MHQPLIGWLLGALLAFCAVLPVAAGTASSADTTGSTSPVGLPAAASGAATLVRSSNSQHVDAVNTSQRPDIGRSIHQLSAATPAEQQDSFSLHGSASVASATEALRSAIATLSVARAPPSVRA